MSRLDYEMTTVMLRRLRDQSREWRGRLDALVAAASVEGVTARQILAVIDGVGGVADDMWGVERDEEWFGEDVER